MGALVVTVDKVDVFLLQINELMVAALYLFAEQQCR